MKLHVLCDKDGKIVSLHAGTVSGSQAAISAAGVMPQKGHILHTIEVTDEVASHSLADIHRLFSVKINKGQGTLVRSSR